MTLEFFLPSKGVNINIKWYLIYVNLIFIWASIRFNPFFHENFNRLRPLWKNDFMFFVRGDHLQRIPSHVTKIHSVCLQFLSWHILVTIQFANLVKLFKANSFFIVKLHFITSQFCITSGNFTFVFIPRNIWLLGCISSHIWNNHSK